MAEQYKARLIESGITPEIVTEMLFALGTTETARIIAQVKSGK